MREKGKGNDEGESREERDKILERRIMISGESPTRCTSHGL